MPGVFGNAKGVIIPHQFVKSIGDIFIVNKGSLPVGGMHDEDMSAIGPSATPSGDKPF